MSDNRPTPWLLPLITRLHFYIGVFVGPFLLIAALSGIVYALTPQLEDWIYRKALYTDTNGPSLSLDAQVASARTAIGPEAQLVAVRPASADGTTTRVMFDLPELGPSQSMAVFIDPVSGEVRDTLDVYGTAGVLPLRSWLDRFHRGLLLGDAGRLYSELAASWLWILAVGGLVLWFARRRSRSSWPQPLPSHALRAVDSSPPNSSDSRSLPSQGRRSSESGRRLRRWHGTLGVWAFLGVVFFSITGLTWSNYAGGNIGVLRAHYGWGTPSVSTTLPAQPMSVHHPHETSASRAGHLVAAVAATRPSSGEYPGDEHAEHGEHAEHNEHVATSIHHQHAATSEHHQHAAHRTRATGDTASAQIAKDPALFDVILGVARAAGIDAGKVEIRPPRSADKAWTVTEVDRSWPTQVDAVSIDPRDLSVLDRTDFESFPLAAKLTRWGIDLHMGTLFGLPNQLALVLTAVCLTIMVVWGYMMWWARRPMRNATRVASRSGIIPLARRAPWHGVLALTLAAVAVGWFLPMMGVSLTAFLVLDAVLQWRTRAAV